MNCEKCGQALAVGDFPFCGGRNGHGRGTGVVVGDDIPGGVLIEHGLCNADGSPRRYDSHSEMRAEAKRRGLVNKVQHIDGSPHTSRWV